MASQAESSKPTPPPRNGNGFPIVGIGASAGGLKAFQDLLTHLPKQPGIAIVLVPHLDPTHESMMSEILRKSTSLPIQEAHDGMKIENNHVYILKPNTSLTLLDGKLRSDALQRAPWGTRHCIDTFLISLARECRGTAIGVILSGSASDGSAGIKAIKAEGGITFAQDSTAEFPGMPEAAAHTGAIDYVLPPKGIAAELTRIARHPYLLAPENITETAVVKGEEEAYRAILQFLETQTGIPFLSYKSSTLERRLTRRMALRQMDSLGEYHQYLLKNPQEIRLLHDEMLINFTSFFREPGTFDALRSKVYPKLIEGRSPKSPLRIWVPGCSTGEEAYSLAISLVEFLDEKGSSLPVQIFASDVSEPSIAKARSGIYPGSIATDISPERLRRFFLTVDGGGYQISKRIRDLVLFARQDMTQDPPFSKLDILSCRNVLIYLGSGLHKRVLPLFHYALRPEGYLILGPSETADRFPTLFRVVDAKHRIYDKIIGSHTQPELSIERHRIGFDDSVAGTIVKASSVFDAARAIDRAILTLYAPPGIVINDEEQVIDVRGQVSPLIRVPSGKPNWTLQRMVQEDLLADLENALREAREKGIPSRREGLQYRVDGQLREVTMCVVPIDGPTARERYFAVLFELPSGAAKPPPNIPKDGTSVDTREMTRLRQTLAAQQDYQQTIIEKLESSNEELRSAHEEVLSANEELQSTNEEMQTAKEELQSSNEELMTLNDELRGRNLELGQVNDDLQNILSSVQIPMIIVDPSLRIRRITPLAEKLLSGLPGDIHRRITDFKPAVEVPNLESLIHSSIDNLSVIEQEVKDRDGRWWLLRVRPYQTSERKIDGAVLTLLDVDALKRSSMESEDRRQFSEAVVQSMRDPLLVLDTQFHVKGLNDAYLRFFKTTKEAVDGKDFFGLGGGLWKIEALRSLLADIIPRNTLFKDFQVQADFPGIGKKILILHARQVRFGNLAEPMILVAIEDVTERRLSEARIRDLNVGLEREVSERTSKLEGARSELEAFTYSVAHDLRAPLRAMSGLGQTLMEDYLGKSLDATAKSYLERIILASRKMDTLIDDLLAFSRLGRDELPLEPLEPEPILDQVLADLEPDVKERQATITIQKPLPAVISHSTTLRQVLANLLSNAIKFVPKGTPPRIVVRAESNGRKVRLWVEDNGIGIAEKHHERIFQVFERLNKTEEYPGTGIGLAIVKRAMERMKGSVGFDSRPGKGSRFWVELPQVPQ